MSCTPTLTLLHVFSWSISLFQVAIHLSCREYCVLVMVLSLTYYRWPVLVMFKGLVAIIFLLFGMTPDLWVENIT